MVVVYRRHIFPWTADFYGNEVVFIFFKSELPKFSKKKMVGFCHNLALVYKLFKLRVFDAETDSNTLDSIEIAAFKTTGMTLKR